LPEPGLGDRLHGLFIPVTTPFDEVTGEVAPVSFRENLRRWVREPIDGILLFGSNGEGPLLDDDEKARLTAFAREVVPAGLPLLAGVGTDSTRAAIRQARLVAAQGADAVLVHPPQYFGAYLPPAAMAAHFRAVADASPVPTIIYHIPKYTKVTLEAGLVGELSRHPNVIGVKDSSGDVKRFAEYTDACGRGCRLFVGNGALLYTALELGAAGAIIGLGLIAPRECADVMRFVREGNATRAGELQNRIAPLHKEIVARHGPVGLKAALELLGYVGGPPRPPLQALGTRDRQAVARVMQEAGVLSGSGRSAIEA
jgi:4-hydroxy-2-oxoglutarate aldolase